MERASQDLSWGRLVLQSLAVILSILIAFALDAWWDGAQEAEQEREILRQLEVEVTATIAEIQDLQGSLEGWMSWLDPEAGLQNLDDEDAETMARTLNALVATPTVNPPTGVYSSVIESGRTRLIRNEELLAKLSGWGDMLQRIKTREAQANDFVWEHVYPYLETRVDIRAVTNWRRVGERGNLPADVPGLAGDLRFLNLVGMKQSAFGTQLLLYRRALDHLEDLSAQLRAEIGGTG